MKIKTVYNRVVNTAGTVALVATPYLAYADELTQPDVSKIVTYIGYATGAVIAIGTAKMIPAAAMWLYSSLTSMVKRG